MNKPVRNTLVAAAAVLLALGAFESTGPAGSGGNSASPLDWLVPPAATADTHYPPISVPMELQRASEHVYYVQGLAGAAFEHDGFISNAAAVVTPEGIVIFDALGTPSLAHRFVEELRKVSDAPIKRVYVSHYHADHIYGLQVFDDLGAEIVAPEGAYEYLNAPQAQERLEERRFSLDPWVNQDTRLVEPDRILHEGETYELGGVTLIVTVVGAAHSDGDMTLFVEPDRVLLSGDVIFEGRVPFVGDANTAHWLEVLGDMQSSDVKALIPGHGPAAENPNQAVALTRRYLDRLREVMGEAVANFLPFGEAYANADWSQFEDLPAFEATHRRNAYQVYLALEAASF